MNSRVKELLTLKTIAETLNQSNELESMLNIVLEKLLEMTELTAGWIFLVDSDYKYLNIADHNLPKALLHEDKSPMKCGNCWCLERYQDGRLNNAVNILSCKRLEDAVKYQWGDTSDITHHATVPLQSGNRRFGVLNVAAPGKTHFTEEELALLQSVAFQIGGSIERTRLFEAEQRRAKLFSKLGEFSRELGTSFSTCSDEDLSVQRVVELVGRHFDWPVRVMIEFTSDDAMQINRKQPIPIADDHTLKKILVEDRPYLVNQSEIAEISDIEGVYQGINQVVGQVTSQLSSAIVIPIRLQDSVQRLLLIGDDMNSRFHPADQEVIEALAEHIAVALKSRRIEEDRRRMARSEERNRLARDLHDSVSQMLFSLSMTAKGAESLLNSNELMTAKSAVQDIQSLSKSALKEMRNLIMQLRPTELESGLITAYKGYSKELDLKLLTEASGLHELSRDVEEALWRIGQEAMNNVSKHADTDEVKIEIEFHKNDAVLRVSDNGCGFIVDPYYSNAKSMGLSSMKERAEALGGKLSVRSEVHKGTTIEAQIPYDNILRNEAAK